MKYFSVLPNKLIGIFLNFSDCGRSLVLDIHNLLLYQGCPSVAATGEGGRNLDVWRVTTWYGDACVAPWYEECLLGEMQ